MAKTIYRVGDRMRCTIADSYADRDCFPGYVATVNDTTYEGDDVIELKLPNGDLFLAYATRWEKIDCEETAAEDNALAYLKRVIKEMVEKDGESLYSSCVTPLTDMLHVVYAIDTGVHETVEFTGARR